MKIKRKNEHFACCFLPCFRSNYEDQRLKVYAELISIIVNLEYVTFIFDFLIRQKGRYVAYYSS